MLSLLEIQRAFKKAVLTNEAPEDLVSVLNVGAIEAADRLNIHRNNYRQTLTSSLQGIFAVAEAFVGEKFLRAVLAQYVAEVPPTEAALNTYGGGVPDFVRAFVPAQKVPYLSDIMALEWAIYELQYAREHNLPSAAQLREGMTGRDLCLSPNARLVESDYPILNLWMAGTGQLPPEAVHANAGGQCACAILQDGEVRLFGLSAPQQNYLGNIITHGEQGADDQITFEQLIEFGLLSLS